MATSISYVLKHKSKFFDTLLNDLQTVSKEYKKWLKKVGILGVKSIALPTELTCWMEQL